MCRTSQRCNLVRNCDCSSLILNYVSLFKPEDIQEAVTAFGEDTNDRQLLLNVEYKGANGDCVCFCVLPIRSILISIDLGELGYK